MEASPSKTFDRDQFRREVEKRLRGLPREAVVSFAARCAWRVMPLLAPEGKWVWGESREICERHFLAIGAAACLAASHGSSIRRGEGEAAVAAARAARAAAAAATAVAATAVAARAAAADDAAARAADYAARAAAAAAYAAADADDAAVAYAAADTDDAAAAAAYAYTAAAAASNDGSDVTREIFDDLGHLRERSDATSIFKFTMFLRSFDSVNWQRACESLGEPGIRVYALWEGFAKGGVDWSSVNSFLDDWLQVRLGPSPADVSLEVRGAYLPISSNSPEDASTRGASAFAEASEAPPKMKEPPPPPKLLRWDRKPKGFTSDEPNSNLTRSALRCCKALRDLLLHPDTKALTVAVEAPWGGGKSSLMRRLQEELHKAKVPTVWFNPWKYEAGKALWAAYALEFDRQLAAGCGRLSRVWKKISLARRRMNAREWLSLGFRSGLWLAGICFVIWAVWHGYSGKDQQGNTQEAGDFLKTWLQQNYVGGVVGILILTAGLLKELFQQLGSPFKADLGKLYGNSSYTEQVDELHRFHEDFRRLVKSYGGSKIVVFIDDLDRCEAPKAAELLQSLHLMMSVDDEKKPSSGKDKKATWVRQMLARLFRRSMEKSASPGIFYVLGMDREKVSAAVAAKHENLLPYLVDKDNDGRASREEARRFGDEFLEKFIHLTLHLPQMDHDDLASFVGMACGVSAEKPARHAFRPPPSIASESESGSTSAGALPENVEGIPGDASPPPDELPVGETPFPNQSGSAASGPADAIAANVQLVDNGVAIARCAWQVAAALEKNPRRIKQFINQLRLRIHLAGRMRCLDLEADPDSKAPPQPDHVTTQHLAKLVALDLAAPEWARQLRMSEDPLVTLQSLVRKETDDPESEMRNVVAMLTYGSSEKDDIWEKGSEHDVERTDPRQDLAQANLKAYYHYIAAGPDEEE